jgi:Cu/Ag efflux pump CusA
MKCGARHSRQSTTSGARRGTGDLWEVTVRALIGSSLRLAPVALAIGIVVLVAGVLQARAAAVQAYPEYAPLVVQVQTEAPGLSAIEVEQLITVPLEDELNGIAFLSSITSQSFTGLSTVDLKFQAGTDELRARQLVAERLAQGPGVANIGSPPVMIQPLSSTGRVMMISLSSSQLSLLDLSTLARWKIRPRLLGVPGVANVSIFGLRDQQLQVLVDPTRLHQNGLTLDQIIDSTGNALWSSPLTFVEASTPGADGFIDTPNQRLAIQHILPIGNAADLAQVAVDNGGDPVIKLGQVTDVVQDHPPLSGDAVLDGGQGLILVVEKFPGADTLQVTRHLQDAMNSMKPGLSGVTVDTTVYQQASFVRQALHNIGLAGLMGLVLMLLLLGAVLASWRAVVISLVTVPLALVAAGYVLYLRGASFNLVTFAGLAVAIGIIVDDTVVSVLEVRRRLRERAAPGDKRAALVLEACLSVRRPLVWAVAVIALATVPLLFFTGVTDSFARTLVFTYLLAVAASLAVALTVTPALASLLGGGSRAGAGEVSRRRGRVLRWFAAHPILAWFLVGLTVLCAFAAVPQVRARNAILPALADRDLVVSWQTLPGTSLPEMDRISNDVSGRLRAIPGVAHVSAEVGRALTSDQITDVNSGELWVGLRSSANYSRTLTAIRALLDSYPGIAHTVLSYPDQQLRQVAAQQTGSAVRVRLYGQDFTLLSQQAEAIRARLGGVAGVVSPAVQSPAQQPTIEVQVNLAAAQKYGLKPGDVRRAATTLIYGLPVGSLYQDQQIFDVVVRGVAADRSDLGSVQNLLIDTPSGAQVKLSDVASIRIAPDPVAVQHDATSRYLDITADVRGRPVGAVLADVRATVSGMQLPVAYHATVSSDLSARSTADHRVLFFALGVLVAVFLLLQAATQSWRRAQLALLLLPSAVAGAAPAAYLVGGITTLGALLGVALVFGVAVRNTLSLLGAYQVVERAGPVPSRRDLLLAATSQRARAILATALATAGALAPFLLLDGVPGGELLRPLAATAIGGLVTATLVALLVLPALYLRTVPAGPGTGIDLSVAGPAERDEARDPQGGAADRAWAAVDKTGGAPPDGRPPVIPHQRGDGHPLVDGHPPADSAGTGEGAGTAAAADPVDAAEGEVER